MSGCIGKHWSAAGELETRRIPADTSEAAKRLTGVMASIGAQGEEAIGDGRWSDRPLAKDARDTGEVSVVVGKE